MLTYSLVKKDDNIIPNEISLCITLGGENKLMIGNFIDIVNDNKDTTCICLIGDAQDLEELYNLFKFVPLLFKNIKVAWFTEQNSIPVNVPKIEYIKTGNQKFYVRGDMTHKMDANSHIYYDFTDRFQK